MGRNKKHNKHLPKRVQLKRGKYYYTQYAGGKVKWLPLGDDYGEALRIWAEYEAEQVPRANTVAKAIQAYIIDKLPSKAPSTQREYRRYAVKLTNVFGDMPLSAVQRNHVGQYLHRHNNQRMANREISMFSSVFDYSIRNAWCNENPCRNIRRNPEKPRTITPSKAEMKSVFKASSPQIRLMILLSLRTALRKSDLLKLKLTDLSQDGISIDVQKTKQKLMIEWSPKLVLLVSRIRKLKRPIRSFYLFCNRSGQMYTPSGFDSLFQRIKITAGAKVLRWHDWRSIAITQAAKVGGKDYAQALAAHRSVTTTELYLRDKSRQKVRPVSFKK